jgi:DNA-binding transcriptional MerR regulator
MSTATPTLPGCFTVGEVAQHFGCREWQIRALYERRLLPPARRFGAYRVISSEDLPAVEDALRAAGYLRDEPATAT